mmetsp:Transcript_994/g.1192  ORF Transcript_994/g.1192 Transcript_994/m.1192 type:complete len:157 (+) Transcript_994:885-1355(+)
MQGDPNKLTKQTEVDFQNSLMEKKTADHSLQGPRKNISNLQTSDQKGNESALISGNRGAFDHINHTSRGPVTGLNLEDSLMTSGGYTHIENSNFQTSQLQPGTTLGERDPAGGVTFKHSVIQEEMEGDGAIASANNIIENSIKTASDKNVAGSSQN